MQDLPYQEWKYFRLSDQWSSRIIVDHADRPALKGLLTPDAITFGTLASGNLSNVQTVTLTNVGYSPLAVDKVRIVGDFIMSSNMPVDGVLDVNESVQFNIQFAPVRDGLATGGLYVDTEDAAGNEFVNLIGYGSGSSSGSLVPSATSLAFGTVTTGTKSPIKTLTLVNNSASYITITALAITGEFATTSVAPIVVGANSSVTIPLTFSPLTLGVKSGSMVLSLSTGGSLTIALGGTGVDAETLPSISVSAGVIEPVDESASVTASPESVSFDSVVVGQSTSTKLISLSNDGLGDATITAITFSDSQFTLGSGSAQVGDVIASGAIAIVRVLATPIAVGTLNGTVAIVAGTDTLTIDLTAVASDDGTDPTPVPLDRLAISGTQFIKAGTTTKVRLKSVNWFGMEGTNYTPHGTWSQPWKNILDDIASMGFNCVRFPFSGDTTTTGRTPPSTAIDAVANPDLVGLTSLEILDLYIDYCTKKGMYVVLDHHRRVAGDGADGSPIDDTYTLAMWQASWAVMANRYKNNTTVVGADLHNEPHDLTWSVWAGYVETCANYLLTLAPTWLFFVEGVGTNSDSTSYWWGGALKDVATRPITLNVASKVAYSPHEYGQSVGSQTWLSTDSTTVSGYPNNLFAVWDANWGFIFKTGIAPIWIGEFGGKFGLDGSGVLNQPNSTPERQWLANLSKYLNGDFNGDGTSDLTGTNLGLSYAYWGYNPNSADTGGLIQDDWVTHQSVKLGLLASLLA